MSQQMIKARTNEVHEFLNKVVFGVDQYLNTHSLNDLIEENGSHEEDYYKQLLKSLRRLNVFCDEARDKLSVLLQAPSFSESSAEKTLYGIYHRCVAEFFSPKGDTWFENSRASYTGNRSIKFLYDPPASLMELFSFLENLFQNIREELDFYATYGHV
ncbi:DUF3907 family protein [Halobacillus amylolyticus]|uniref:YpuI family protein n=1 Tax=Halobacillus amylolyticus TaxID=2932259 RepID=A0ABY4HDB1_9BACI|nr:DUF3907 family protein [Halobacillus amylolyticus]UOR12417.1 YpuI family protein [Halobacillus amylolyticus]